MLLALKRKETYCWFNFLSFVGVLFLLLASEYASAVESIRKLSTADFLHTDSTVLPSASESWLPVRLPDMWRGEQHNVLPPLGWYRFDLGPIPDDPEQGIAITRTLMTADYYFNGIKIGRVGGDPDHSRYWNTPAMFRIPSGLWQSESNELLIRLAGPPGFIMLVPLEIGPYDLIQASYDRKRFLQNFQPAFFIPILLTISAFFFTLWFRQRAETQYFWIALAASFWAVYNINLAVAEFPFSTRIWQWFAHSCTDLYMVSMAFFANRLTNNKRAWQDRLYFIFAILALLSYALTSQNLLTIVPVILHLIGLGIFINGALELFGYARRYRNKQFALIASGLLFSLLLGFYDLYMSTRPAAVVDTVIFLGAIAVPVVFMGISWYLTGRFVNALIESRRLNTELESRVNRARSALEEIYISQSIVEKEKAVIEERDRIYRDLHDDIGAKLLSLIYKTDGSDISEIARSALQDLRDVVTRSESGEAHLLELLADWRLEAEQRLLGSQISLLWEQADDLSNESVSSAWAVNIARILREAISNIIKHADADIARVIICQQGRRLHIRIDDNGHGLPDQTTLYSRGMNNMKRRAEQLQGQITWQRATSGGCSVQFRMPLDYFTPPEQGVLK
ncbi:MAG: hypothetical protein MJA28_10440 [Gammaproteobacteria bacterium]|nr:hypothetical protein [Gammaproteobacteria bacterium]